MIIQISQKDSSFIVKIFETHRATFYDEMFDQNEDVNVGTSVDPVHHNMAEWFVFPDIVPHAPQMISEELGPKAPVENQTQAVNFDN